jgi:hypothetical protein
MGAAEEIQLRNNENENIKKAHDELYKKLMDFDKAKGISENLEAEKT